MSSSSSSNCKYSCTAGLVGLSFAGFLLSLYTSYVEIRAERDHSYEAMCDISERISCTKVLHRLTVAVSAWWGHCSATTPPSTSRTDSSAFSTTSWWRVYRSATAFA
nr:uncharacterized protein LOC109415799 [Aedes albopictus]